MSPSDAKTTVRPAPSSTSKTYSSNMSKFMSQHNNSGDEILYTLGRHARYLHLTFETSVDSNSNNNNINNDNANNPQPKRYWYCDWTKHFVPNTYQNQFMHSVVKEYCQPFSQDELEDMYVGTTTLSQMKKEPLAVRTIMLRIRPDCDHIKVYQALNDAFQIIHSKHYAVLKNENNSFQAIGSDGNEPLLLSASIITHKQIPNLERYVLLRFYHVQQVHLLEEILQQIGGISKQKSPLREVQTPLNNKLGEACAMIQCIYQRPEIMNALNKKQQETIVSSSKQHRMIKNNHRQHFTTNNNANPVSLLNDIPSPKNSTRETSRYFMERMLESPSVLDENYEKLHVFPSLSNRDYDLLQETWPLLDRIWSELELCKCTYNTLVDETSRFGMRPCQPTLDKDYCIQLFQISQQRMLQDLRSELNQAENTLHDTLRDYSELEQQLTNVMMRSYNIPINMEETNPFNRRDHTSDSLDVGQTPVSLIKRDIHDFPWEFNDITMALQDITHTITCVCLEQDYDPILHSLQVCERSVDHIFFALEQANDCDQQDFLKRRNRQAMVRLSQQQLYLKEVLRRLSNAPTTWEGLPKLQKAVKYWQEIAEQASNKDEARPQGNWVNKASDGIAGSSAAKKAFQVPLLEFTTKFGTACITQNTLVLLSEMPFFEGAKAYEINKVEVVVLHKHPLHRMVIMRHGKRLCGFTPTSIDPEKLSKFVQILKSLQH